MAILNEVMVLICIALMSTFPKLRNRFRQIEVMVYLMVIILAFEQIHSAIIDNFNLVIFSKKFSAFFFYKMNQLIVIPIAILWLLYSFYSDKIHFLFKALFTGGWFFGLFGLYKLFHKLGILTLTGWNLKYSTIISLTVLVVSVCFSLWFRTLLRKGDDRDSVSAGTIRPE